MISRLFAWQGQKDSNPQQRFWRPTCYHYTMPLRLSANKSYYSCVLHFCQALFVIFGGFLEIGSNPALVFDLQLRKIGNCGIIQRFRAFFRRMNVIVRRLHAVEPFAVLSRAHRLREVDVLQT